MLVTPKRHEVAGHSFLDRVIEAGWLVIAADLPIWFAPWGLNVFELPKALLLWVIVALMGAARLLQPAPSERGGSRGQWLDRAALAALIFSGVLILATLFSANPLLSAIGSYDRMEGLITSLCDLALFLMVAERLSTVTRVQRLQMAVAWGSLPVMVYGGIQVLGLDPFQWHFNSGPIIATLGNSNFFGAYLVLVLPFTWACLRAAHSRPEQAIYAALMGAQVVFLIAIRARAAWLGTLAAAMVLFLTIVYLRRRRVWMAYAALACAGALLVALGVFYQMPNKEGSNGARWIIWKGALELFDRRPVLGYGPDTFAQTFTTVYPKELVYYQGRAVTVDRAHNLVLDTLASSGLLGLCSLALLVGLTLTAGITHLRQAGTPSSDYAVPAALAAAVGHLVETQFSFEPVTTATLFWLVLAILVAHSPNTEQVGRSDGPARRVEPAAQKGAVYWLRRPLAGSLLLIVVPLSLILLIADAYAAQADVIRTDPLPGVIAAEHAVSLWPTQPAYYERLSWLHLQQALNGGGTETEFRAAERSLDRARSLAPADYSVWVAYGELYSEWGIASSPERFAFAEVAYRQAESLFPNNAMLHTGWGLLYAAQERWPDAAEQFSLAVALDNTDAWAYRYLGEVLYVQGDLDGAEKAFTSARRWTTKLR